MKPMKNKRLTAILFASATLAISTCLIIVNTACGKSHTLYATFTFAQTTGCTMQPVFISNVTPDADTYNWTVDGEQYSTEKFPQFVFKEPGTKTVELTVTRGKKESVKTVRQIRVSHCANVSFWMSKSFFKSSFVVSMNGTNKVILSGLSSPPYCNGAGTTTFSMELNSQSQSFSYYANDASNLKVWSDVVVLSPNSCELIQLQ